jgi:acyl-coenzyme A thioesterase PaaI-like protein
MADAESSDRADADRSDHASDRGSDRGSDHRTGTDRPDALSGRSMHPAIAGRERPMAELADTVRRLVELVVTNTADAAVLHGVVSQLRAVADVLAEHVPDQPVPRFVEPPAGKARRHTMSSMNGSMPYDPVVGRYNPIALPVTISYEPPSAVGSATFTTPYEGGPGWVHGAAIAAAFDIVLTAANHIVGAAGPTVWLTVRFRRPTLVGIEARFEAEVVNNDGRRVTSRGRLIQDGLVCVEAEGEFAVLDTSKLRATAARSRRRRPAD